MNIHLHTQLKSIKALLKDDHGMSTVEYAMGCLAAAAIATVLYTVMPWSPPSKE